MDNIRLSSYRPGQRVVTIVAREAVPAHSHGVVISLSLEIAPTTSITECVNVKFKNGHRREYSVYELCPYMPGFDDEWCGPEIEKPTKEEMEG